MRKSSLWVLFMAAIVAAMATPAFAEAEAAAKSAGGANSFYIAVAIVAAAAMAFAAVGVSFAQSHAIKAAVEGIARNPGASGKILPTLLIGLAMLESLAIYVLVIALILLFANPFLKFLS